MTRSGFPLLPATSAIFDPQAVLAALQAIAVDSDVSVRRAPVMSVVQMVPSVALTKA